MGGLDSWRSNNQTTMTHFPTPPSHDTRGLKCNLKVVRTVKKSMGPCKILWAPFNFAAGPCISSQALYLDQIQIDSGRRPYVPTGKTITPVRSHGKSAL